jgi:hypothetical protein
MIPYDSKADTLEHIKSVNEKLLRFSMLLMNRAIQHDKSKLESPEKELIDQHQPVLKNLVFGSEEYYESLRLLKPSLDHHYFVNSHHPQHYGDKGVNGMTLMDVCEMLMDWWAASERMKDGDIRRSIKLSSYK